MYERRYAESTHQIDANTCPECDGRVTMNTAEVVCDDCGLILADNTVDMGPEWRSFDGPDRSRAGPPRTSARHDRGLSTEIGYNCDARGRTLDGKTKRRLGRLRREHRRGRFQSKAERNQAYGFTQIRRIVGALGLGKSFRDQACRLFASGQEAGLFPGRSIEAMAAAAVYATCRCRGRPETRVEITRFSRVSDTRVRNAYRVLNTELGLPAVPRSPATFLPKLVSALDLPQAVERRAQAILEADPDSDGGSGANPIGIAGGALLIAATDLGVREEFTQRELAHAADVTPVTLRGHRDSLLSVSQHPSFIAD